jgi:peptide-methionine (S)-S-oxide reductase
VDALERATLAGGCFWCLEPIFAPLKGVHEVMPGYIGGKWPNPSYERVCTGTTGHAEAVQIDFDPAVLGFRTLLEVFFGFHDPTTLDRQGGDVGTQYRSAIFYHSEEQRRAAEALIEELTERGVFPGPIVTEVAPATEFYPAEEYHRDYYANNAAKPYCQVVIAPKVRQLRQRYAELLDATG